MSTFFPGDPRPEVQDFVAKYKAKYDEEPDSFSAGAYDTMMLFAQLCDQFGTTREAIHDGPGRDQGRPERHLRQDPPSTPQPAASPAPTTAYLQVVGRQVRRLGRQEADS